MSAEPAFPDHVSVLRTTDPDLDGAPLFAVNFDAWDGAADMYAAYRAGQDLTVSSSIDFFRYDGQFAVVFSIAALEFAVRVQVAVSCQEERYQLRNAARRSVITLVGTEVFKALPDDHDEMPLDPESRIIMVIPIRGDELMARLSQIPKV